MDNSQSSSHNATDTELPSMAISTMSANIEALSIEVLEMIARLLDDKTLNNLHVTSKTIRRGTTREFVRRHFLERNHLMTRFGLDSLVEIIKHPFYGYHIRTITFNVSTDLSDAEIDDPTCFSTSISNVFSNIKRLQMRYKYNITIGFSDNYPDEYRESSSGALYQIVQKPSYGWYTLLLQHKMPMDFPFLYDVNLITTGDMMQRVLPLAISSGCHIVGLDIRFVGRLLETERKLHLHQPGIKTLLKKLKLPAEWNMKFSITDCDRTHISTIQYTGTDQKLKFHGFLLGDLNIDDAEVYAYDIASKVLPGKFRQLELVDCCVKDTKHLATQLKELGHFRKYDKSYLTLESLVIRGLWIRDSLCWSHVFESISKVKTLKRCFIEDLHLQPSKHMDGEEDESEEDESEEIGGEEDESEEDESEEIGSEEDESEEDESEEIGNEEIGGEEHGNGDANGHDAEEGMARLERMLANVHIKLDAGDGHDITKELLGISASFVGVA